jgi:hypothetical protein
LHVEVAFVDIPADAHLIVDVHAGSGRADQKNWFTDDVPTMNAHEVGHQLGLTDRYASPQSALRPNEQSPRVDNESLMGNFWRQDPEGNTIVNPNTHLRPVDLQEFEDGMGTAPQTGASHVVGRSSQTAASSLQSAGPVRTIAALGVQRPVDRHFIRNVDQNTVAKSTNTVIAPRVDVGADVMAIRKGAASEGINSDGIRTFTIHDRTYGMHDSGTLFPMSGDGLFVLDRGAFHALGVYNKFGTTPRATEILDRMEISDIQREAALSAWRAAQ